MYAKALDLSEITIVVDDQSRSYSLPIYGHCMTARVFDFSGMEGFKKSIYLLTKEETKTALTLSEIAQLRKGQRFQSGVTFSQDMTDNDVRILLENLFSPILSNKRFSCATREGQTSTQFNFHGEHRVWDGRMIKRKVKGQSAMYLVLEDEVEDKLVFNPVLPAIGTPSSLQGHLSSTSFCHNSKNSKNSQTVSLTQTPQSATTVTSMNTTNSTENAEETTQWEQDMCINEDDILSSLNFSDIGSENPLSPTGFGAIETLSEASFLASRSQEQNQLKNQIPSTSTDTFQSSDSAFSSSKDIWFENLFPAIDFGAVETIMGAPFLTNRSQEQNQLQNQILSTSTDTFQSGDSAFSSSEETVSQNGIFSAQGTTQEGRVTKPIWLMENNCLPSDKSDFSGQSDSGISSEARVCLSQAPNPPISLRIQEARIKPTDGPLEGGGLFSAEIDEELPRSMETGWAIFGNKSVKVRIARDGLALFGDKIPRGDTPGPVTVTFTTLDGERVAEATYTYKRRENPTTWQIKRALDGVEESVKRLRSVADSYESYEFAAENYHESGIRERERERGSGDAPEPVTVTFTTLDGECEAKATYTYKKRENPTTWQITLVKRSLDDIEEYVKRLRRVAYTCCERDEFAAENYHESGGDAPEPVTVTFTTLDGECEAKATYSCKERENPTTWQITRVKRALDGVEKSVKRLRSAADSCYDSDEFAAENYHESVVTQVVKAQLIEEGYFGDAEKSDIEDEDYDLMDNNENEIDEGESFVSLDPRHPSTETDVYQRRRHEDIGKRWVELAQESDFKKSVIDSIKNDNLSEKERCIDLSVQWMEKEGRDGATAGKLANVSTETGLKTLAENLLGPLNGIRKKVIESTGTIRSSNNNEELKNYVDASSHIAAETFENTGEMGSSAEKEHTASNALPEFGKSSSFTFSNYLIPAAKGVMPLLWEDPKEMLAKMREKERKCSRDPLYFRKHLFIQPRMRAILLDWLTEVCEVYRLHRETYYLAVDFVDRYLSVKHDIAKQKLQLVGTTALFIAAKLEEICAPKISEFAYVTDGACTENEILKEELRMLKGLCWNLTPITVNSWSYIYLQLFYVTSKSGKTSNFSIPYYLQRRFVQVAQLLDLCILDVGSLQFSYSILAASAIYHLHPVNVEQVTGYSREELHPCIQWMTPFAHIIMEKGAATIRSFEKVQREDAHNIQTHAVDKASLDKALALQSTLSKETAENRSRSPNIESFKPLTPPSSKKKPILDSLIRIASNKLVPL